MTDWEAIRKEYMDSDISLRALARKHGLSHSTLQNHAGRERWAKCRAAGGQEDPRLRMEQVAAKLLRRMERTIDAEEEMDSKDIKAMTGALKEIKEIQRQEPRATGEDKDEVLEVRFLGEAEELSR